MATTTAYSRPSKLPGGGPGERRPPPPRLIRAFFGSGAKIEPRKLGAGLLAGCCLALLTYVSLAKLYAVYSPVFATTSALLQNAPPSPEAVAAPRPPKEPAFAGGKNGTAVDRVDLSPATAASQEPGVPEALSRKEHAEKAPAPANTSAPMPSEEGKRKSTSSNVTAGPMSCDENGVDEGFPYARPAVCELSGDIHVSPSQKIMYLVNPSGGGGFDEKGEKRLRPYARNDDFLLPAVVEVTVKSVASPAAAPQCTKQHRVPAVVFSVAGYTDNFFHDNTDVLIPLFLTTAHLKGEVQLLITNYKPWWVQKYTPVLRKLSNYDVINFDDDADVHCFSRGYLGLYRDRDLIIAPHPTRNPRNYTMVDYTRFLRAAYGLRRDQSAVLGAEPGMQPRMLIISRSGTRKLLNQEEVAATASELGFNVTVAEAGDDVPAFAALVNSADVLLAVHGAGLTNQIFLPTQRTEADMDEPIAAPNGQNPAKPDVCLGLCGGVGLRASPTGLLICPGPSGFEQARTKAGPYGAAHLKNGSAFCPGLLKPRPNLVQV